jgi:hypothetical protein
LARIGELEDQLRGSQRFDGDALQLLRATAAGAFVPTNQQLYAARIILERDLDARVVELDANRAALEEQRRDYDRGTRVLDDLIAKFEEICRDRSDKLDGLVQSGDVTPEAAAILRGWYVDPDEALSWARSSPMRITASASAS